MYTLEYIDLSLTAGQCVVDKYHIALGVMPPSAQMITTMTGVMDSNYQDIEANKKMLNISNSAELVSPRSYGHVANILDKDWISPYIGGSYPVPTILSYDINSLRFYYLVK